MDINNFLSSIAGNSKSSSDDRWSEVIRPATSNLIIGDIGKGKSALAYWLLERFSKEYGLTAAVVGFPREKQSLLPSDFVILDEPQEVAKISDAIIFIDEADLQLPIEDVKAREHVINFLSLPGHRDQILLLAFHFPRLIMVRYLPFFRSFIIKRPPYLLEFASKSRGDMLARMMSKAEERFAELLPEDVVKNSYVVAPELRWQGMMQNPLPSFWSEELRKGWSGVIVSDQLTLEEAIEQVRGKCAAKGERDPYWYTVDELREMCREKGLPTNGDKHALVLRLFGR